MSKLIIVFLFLLSGIIAQEADKKVDIKPIDENQVENFDGDQKLTVIKMDTEKIERMPKEKMGSAESSGPAVVVEKMDHENQEGIQKPELNVKNSEKILKPVAK